MRSIPVANRGFASRGVMYQLLTLIFLSIPICSYCQEDSVLVRVQNTGRFNIQQYKLTVNDKKYIFSDIQKNSYSEYQKLPFIATLHPSKTTIIINRTAQPDEQRTIFHFPVDNIEQVKYTTGNFTIQLHTYKKGKELIVKESIHKE